MGHRANYILKNTQGYRLFYSHWGANVIEADLFWGPQEAERFILSQKETDEWLDEVWCEGGACLDYEAKTLLFFGGEDLKWDPFRRAASLPLIRHLWAPWQVRWADNEILDLARQVGVPDQSVLSPNQSPSKEEPIPTRHETLHSTSVLEIDGQASSYSNDLEALLSWGPQLLPKLSKQALLMDKYPPTSAATIDTAQRQLTYWSFTASPPFHQKLPELWNGWTVHLDTSRALSDSCRFLKAAKQPLPCWEQTLQEIEEAVCRNIPSRALTLESLKEIHGAQAKIELNPLATTDIRPQHRDLDLRTRFAKACQSCFERPLWN